MSAAHRDAADLARQLLRRMEHDFHHNLVDIPVSVNLDVWIWEMKAIIEILEPGARRRERAA